MSAAVRGQGPHFFLGGLTLFVLPPAFVHGLSQSPLLVVTGGLRGESDGGIYISGEASRLREQKEMGNATLRARQFMLADAPPKLVALATTLALNGMGARLCILAVQTDTVG